MMSTHPDVRNFIADRLGLPVERLTDELHLTDDLRFDRFDRLELAMEIEDRFGVVFTQEALDRMGVIGDLIRYVEDDLLQDRPVIIPPSIAPSGRQW
jgi:acyl carrier protein